MSALRVGDVWSGPLGNRFVEWTVTWVGTKKARLKADVDYGWANATVNATVSIVRMLDSPDWERVEGRQ